MELILNIGLLMLPENPEKQMQEIAKNMKTASHDGKFKSSTRLIMEVLLGIKNPGVVALYTTASRWNKKATSSVESLHSQINLIGDVSTVLAKMKDIEKVKTFHPAFAERLSVVQTDLNKIQAPIEETGSAMAKYIQKLHTQLSADKSNTTQDLNTLKNELQNLTTQIDVLNSKAMTLFQKLTQLHNEAYLLLPEQNKAGLKEPVKPAVTVPTQERPT